MKKLSKLLIILQLALSFSLLIWYVTAPFGAELYLSRARLFQVQTLLGDPSLTAYSPESEKLLQENQKKVANLAEEELYALKDDAKHFQEQLNRGFFPSLLRVCEIFFRELPSLLLTYLFLSLALSFALLYPIEGALPATLLLPLVALALLWENSERPSPQPTPEELLFPKKIEFAEGTTEKERFEAGWEAWIKKKWGDRFYLNHALIKKLREHPTYIKPIDYSEKREPLWLLLLFLWSTLFSWVQYRGALCATKHSGQHSSPRY